MSGDAPHPVFNRMHRWGRMVVGWSWDADRVGLHGYAYTIRDVDRPPIVSIVKIELPVDYRPYADLAEYH